MKEKFNWINFGSIKPDGWILKEMEKDLCEGFLGHLDEIVPDLIVKDDIYGEHRLTKKVKSKDVGAIAQDEDWEVQYLWWNSETQSNWYDGLIRTAILTENKEYLEKVRDYIENKLSTQDEDGYLGIYAPDLRFSFNSENGELWAQATLLRGMLGYYEANSDKKILEAIERAVNVIMTSYPINASHPFKAENSYAGLCHGLTITDVFDRLHQITGNKKYLEYAGWLYCDYCKYELSEQDIQIKNLLDPEYKFSGHGVHTYEHLRALVIAYYASGDLTYKKGIEEYLNRLETCTTPSGGPIGDEWISREGADATKTGYEYCSIHELLDSYSLLLQKTGDMTYADKLEHIFYNAAKGAKHPEESSIAYLKTDNSYSMKGVEHIPNPDSMHKIQTRYKYSPSHQDAAVCCVPNAGRIYPYFVKSMWMLNEDGIVATLFGPNKLDTTINGVNVIIEEKTNYPYENNVEFNIKVEIPIKFTLSLRKPSWADKVQVNIKDAEVIEEDDLITIKKIWNKSETVSIKFTSSVKVRKDNKGETYITKGPIVFALPIEANMEVVKEYNVIGLRDLYYEAKNNDYENLVLSKNTIKDDGTLALYADFINSKTKKVESHKLIPIGESILRRVTFNTKEK